MHFSLVCIETMTQIDIFCIWFFQIPYNNIQEWKSFLFEQAPVFKSFPNVKYLFKITYLSICKELLLSILMKSTSVEFDQLQIESHYHLFTKIRLT